MEDVLAMFSETGIHVVEAADAEPDDDDQREEPEEEEGAVGETVEVQRPAAANVKKAELPERTDDPVGMYLQACEKTHGRAPPARRLKFHLQKQR
jgi:hypothetical protein